MHIKAIIFIVIVFVMTHSETAARCRCPQDSIPRPKALFKADTVTICVMGDMMMHERQIDLARRNDGTYDFSSYFHHIKDRISSADIAIANMEFTLSGEPYSGYPSFSAPDAYAEYLAQCGFDIFLAANNHIFDKGGEGAERTLRIFRELGRKYGIRVCGLAETPEIRENTTPLEILVKGMRIALINFTYGTNLGSDRHWPKTNYMREKSLISAALAKTGDCDLTIVLPHWGNEYELIHSQEQEELAEELAIKGADIIIGTHPHVPQDIGSVTKKGTPVIYSLGNGVSNMSAPDTQIELMAEITLIRRTDGSTGILPVRLTYLWCSRPGGLTSTYTVIPIKEYIGKKDMWTGSWDYDKMIATYERVSRTIGIE